jgi:hypothetical protein
MMGDRRTWQERSQRWRKGLSVHNELQAYQRDETATRKEKNGMRGERGEGKKKKIGETRMRDHQIKLKESTTANAGVGKIRCFPRKQLPRTAVFCGLGA